MARAPEDAPQREAMPRIVGIVNATADSFSDGGRYLAPEAAVAHARDLLRAGAHLVEIGPASSRPEAARVSAEQEIRRLAPILDGLEQERRALCVDSCRPETQRYGMGRGVRGLNDIQGFAHEEIYEELARSRCLLFVMHSVRGGERAERSVHEAGPVLAGMHAFFQRRIERLLAAGVARERLVLDPGMGLFLGSNPEPSLAVLRELPRLRRAFELPVMISVSRKSFLGSLTGRGVHERGAATLAAEIFAALQGADYIRTHDVAALRDALAVLAALGPLPHGREPSR